MSKKLILKKNPDDKVKFFYKAKMLTQAIILKNKDEKFILDLDDIRVIDAFIEFDNETFLLKKPTTIMDANDDEKKTRISFHTSSITNKDINNNAENNVDEKNRFGTKYCYNKLNYYRILWQCYEIMLKIEEERAKEQKTEVKVDKKKLNIFFKKYEQAFEEFLMLFCFLARIKKDNEEIQKILQDIRDALKNYYKITEDFQIEKANNGVVKILTKLFFHRASFFSNSSANNHYSIFRDINININNEFSLLKFSLV